MWEEDVPCKCWVRAFFATTVSRASYLGHVPGRADDCRRWGLAVAGGLVPTDRTADNQPSHRHCVTVLEMTVTAASALQVFLSRAYSQDIAVARCLQYSLRQIPSRWRWLPRMTAVGVATKGISQAACWLCSCAVAAHGWGPETLARVVRRTVTNTHTQELRCSRQSQNMPPELPQPDQPGPTTFAACFPSIPTSYPVLHRLYSPQLPARLSTIQLPLW